MVAGYEAEAGVTLRPGDPGRMILNAVAYEVGRTITAINDAALQNLLGTARGEWLDGLGELVGVQRKTPIASSTVLRFTRAPGIIGDVAIPVATRVSVNGLVFETAAAATIEDLEAFVDVAAIAADTGTAGNGYLPAQLKTLVDGPLAGVANASNVTTTTGGATVETDDELRARIRGALAATTVAGPVDAYRALALASHPDVVDAAVTSPRPGLVRVSPVGRLTETGTVLLPEGVLDIVLAALSAETARPLCDEVEVVQPAEVTGAIRITWVGDRARNAEMADIQTAVIAAVEAFRVWQVGGLGRDLNPSRLAAGVMAVSGVKRVAIALPLATSVPAGSIVRLTSVAVVFGGVEDP